jgi:hypothetical protein
VPEGTLLSRWESFYVIVGSSAGALIGLMFVVVTLGAERGRQSSQGFGAYATPTIIHFCVALLISATLSAPWQAMSGVSLTLAVVGVLSLGYLAIVTRRARRQTIYQPVWEDWIWHTIMPAIAYVTLLVAGLLLQRVAVPCLFLIGATALLLLFIGIHNSWDTILFLALDMPAKPAEQPVTAPPAPSPPAPSQAAKGEREVPVP